MDPEMLVVSMTVEAPFARPLLVYRTAVEGELLLRTTTAFGQWKGMLLVLGGRYTVREFCVAAQVWADRLAHIQNCLPELLPEEREFMISGITPEEWKAFVEDEDSEECDI